MRILIVSPYEVFPPFFGGQVRIYNLAKELSDLGNEVTVACNYTGLKIKRNFTVGNVKIIFFKTYIQDLVAFLNEVGLAPLIISYPFHKIIRSSFRNLLVGYDLVQFEQPFFSCMMDMVPKDALIVYSSQNVELDFDLISYKKSLLYGFYRRILMDCERTALQKSDIVTTVSIEDKEKLASLYKIRKDKIFVIENGFERNYTAKGTNVIKEQLKIDKNKKIAIFVGSATPPNRDAVRFITQKIAPANQDINFLLVGNSANSYAGNVLNVLKIGKVENLDKYLEISDVGLLPIEEGSGSNLKLLSYLKYGLQVVSTNFGMRGYSSLKKYINVIKLSEFPSKIRHLPKKTVPAGILKRYEWTNLAFKLDKVYIAKLINSTRGAEKIMFREIDILKCPKYRNLSTTERLLLQNHFKRIQQHSLVVGKLMYLQARKLNENAKDWETAGILHDIDYARSYYNIERHGFLSPKILRQYKLSENIVNAIKYHGTSKYWKTKFRLGWALHISEMFTKRFVHTIRKYKYERIEDVDFQNFMRVYNGKDFRKNERLTRLEESSMPYKDFKKMMSIYDRDIEGFPLTRKQLFSLTKESFMLLNIFPLSITHKKELNELLLPKN